MARLDLSYGYMDSPIGTLTITSSSRGLCRVDFGAKTEDEIKRWAGKWSLTSIIKNDDNQIAHAVEQLEQYFQKKRTYFDLPIHLMGTPFQIAVWNKLSLIPYGQTRTYKDIATDIGSPKAIRAVGGANNKNPLPIIIPCHRVIGSNGSLVGYGGGLSNKEVLLSIEKDD